MKWISDGFELASGRNVSANRSIVGISPDWREHDIFEGYDGGITTTPGPFSFSQDTPWTPEERRELAEEMIRLWSDFGNLHGQPFGFTREDVRIERGPHRLLETPVIVDGERVSVVEVPVEVQPGVVCTMVIPAVVWRSWLDRADRIEALLPPEAP